jgi:hypothetical protein
MAPKCGAETGVNWNNPPRERIIPEQRGPAAFIGTPSPVSAGLSSYERPELRPRSLLKESIAVAATFCHDKRTIRIHCWQAVSRNM